jgi:hypothetical protein
MSLITLELTIPPNTTLAAPAEVSKTITVRNLKSVSYNFPDGCLGAAYVRLLDTGTQILPFIGWINGNNESVAWAENRRLTDNARLTFQGYNLAVDWPHTITVDLIIE